MSKREATLEAELKEARLEIQLLKEKVDALVRLLYASKSEKLDPNQLMLLQDLDPKKEEAPAAVETEPGAEKPRRTHTKKERSPRVPDHLPVKEEVIEPELVKADPDQWRLIGEEVSEQLDYEPAQFWKRRLVRRKYARRDNPYLPPIIAPLLNTLQERCLATPNLLAQVIVSKYVDHLPLYRQEQIYRSRHGVEIPRQTLCRWVSMAAGELELLYEAMKNEQAHCQYLQVDETPIRYLKPGAGKAPQGYLWVSSVPSSDVIYHWHAGRAAGCLHELIDEKFNGILQCDGYSAYPSFQKQRAGPLELAGCWAHVRRKFYEAQERAPVMCAWMLRQIAQLYQVERRLREQNAGASLREAIRASESKPIVERIQKALLKLKPRYLPQSGLGKAIHYAIAQWEPLQVFLRNGAVEIDNNLIENAIRPTKLGMKNWMFIGSETSGKTSAILYTLIESAKRHGLEPHAYISHVLRELPNATNWTIKELMPAAVAKTKRITAA